MLLFVRISSYYYFIEEKRTAIYLWALYEHVVGGVTVCAANFDQRLLKFYHEGPNSVVGKSIAGGREVEPHGVEQYPPVPESCAGGKHISYDLTEVSPLKVSGRTTEVGVPWSGVKFKSVVTVHIAVDQVWVSQAHKCTPSWGLKYWTAKWRLWQRHKR